MQHSGFQWHQDAALFAGTVRIARPDARPPRGFHCITEAAPEPMLTALGQALCAGDPFCVTPRAVAGAHAPQGAFLTLTGGSTGAPKAICRTQASWLRSFAVNQSLFGWSAKGAVATLGLPHHSLALYAVLEALHLGRQAHVLAGCTPAAMRAALAAHAIDTLYATPTQLRALTRGRPKTALHHMAHVLCGGGALDEATRRAIQALFPAAQIRCFYGAAETSFITLTDANTPEGSVGAAYPDVTLRITDGAVWVRSPYLAQHYATSPPEPLQHKDGFVSVGELGRLDPQGNLWLEGRRDRLVQVADQTVSPEAVERLIQTHPDVQSCAVLPVADPVRGQRLVALVHGTENPALTRAVQTLCRARFGPLIAPRQVVFVADWPVLPSGKTDLVQLAALLEDTSP